MSTFSVYCDSMNVICKATPDYSKDRKLTEYQVYDLEKRGFIYQVGTIWWGKACGFRINNAEGFFVDAQGNRHWKIYLEFEGRKISTNFSTGGAWNKEPHSADVLSCLISDGQFYESAPTLGDFLCDIGCDFKKPDNINRAIETYEACKNMALRIRMFLGKHYDDFQRESLEH